MSWMLGSDIPSTRWANRMNHKPKRPRKLLLHRKRDSQVRRQGGAKGFTLVPLRMYFKEGAPRLNWRWRAARKCTTNARRPRRRRQRDIQRAMRERRATSSPLYGTPGEGNGSEACPRGTS